MKNVMRLMRAWPLLRILRMALGIAATIQGIWMGDVIPIVFGLFLGVTAWLNVGCCDSRSCGPDGCEVPRK